MYGTRIFLLAVLSFSVSATPVLGADWERGRKSELSPELREGGWSVLVDRDFEPTRFLWRGNGIVQIDTNDSVGFLFRELSAEERAARSMSWRWQVVRDLPPADLSKREADDRPLAVHLWFDSPQGQSNWWTEAGRSVLRWIGMPVPGRILTYVWGGAHDPGASFPSPYRPADGWVIVLRPSGSPVSTWQEQRVDPQADYAKYFDSRPLAPRFVAISGDSDNLGGTSSGLVTLPVFR